MACFIVPVAEAAVTTAAARLLRSHGCGRRQRELADKLGWLNRMLWGGSALLAFEHVWHGEVTPWFPFLTAAADPESKAVMLEEMSTVGVGMAVLVTAAWAVLALAAHALAQSAAKTVKEKC